MVNPEYQIGMFGTFDVGNFGDQLFPLLAKKELSQRLGELNIRPFSYHAKSKPNWPYTITSLTELSKTAHTLDCALIGGGHIIRFDKYIAQEYFPPETSIHHPTGYWLAPALIALQQGIPIIWNTPGVYENEEFPEWSHPLLEFVFQNSPYISVRDEESKIVLSRFVDQEKIILVPDTAYGISRLIDQEKPSAEYERLRSQLGLAKPYIILQATETINLFLSQMATDAEAIQNFNLLVLPISPALGDHCSKIIAKLPNLIYLNELPHPLLTAELISKAEGVIGYSLHLSITALAFGIPVFRPESFNIGKYRDLSFFKTVHQISGKAWDRKWFTSKLGKGKLSPEVIAYHEKLAIHWDTISNIISKGKINNQSVINQFLQNLPNKLETQQTLKESLIAARDNQINALYNSSSWKITSPLRSMANILRKILRRS